MTPDDTWVPQPKPDSPSAELELAFSAAVAAKDQARIYNGILTRIAQLPIVQSFAYAIRMEAAFGDAFHRSDWNIALKSLRRPDNSSVPSTSEPPPPRKDLYVPRDSSEKPMPNDIGRMIMRDHDLLLDNVGVLREYNGRHWEPAPADRLRSYAMQYDSHEHTSARRRNEAAQYVMDSVRQVKTPWRALGASEIPCSNGVVDATTGVLRPHRREDYLETCIPHDYNPSAECPLWLAVLDSWFASDTTDGPVPAALALQEFFGYCLLPHALYKKALFLFGESDTGKSQIPLIMGELVGSGNRCTLSTDQMADERKRAPIVGKMVNLLSELPAGAMIKDGGFKQLVSTGDPISIDEKYVSSYTYIPFCKHIVCCNSLPRVDDHSRATFNRLLLIQFTRVIPADQQDKELLQKLIKELPGMLAWAVAGAARLIANNGEFTRIAASEATIEDYRKDQNPINEFLEERCEKVEGGVIAMEEIRDRFRTFTGKSWASINIANMIKAMGAKVEPRKVRGDSKRALLGYRWRDVGAMPFDPGPVEEPERKRWRQ